MSTAVVNSNTDAKINRLLGKLEKRNHRITGLLRRIALLESALATKTIEERNFSRDVTRAVQSALCNVRMIPIHGIRDSKIIEIKVGE